MGWLALFVSKSQRGYSESIEENMVFTVEKVPIIRKQIAPNYGQRKNIINTEAKVQEQKVQSKK